MASDPLGINTKRLGLFCYLVPLHEVGSPRPNTSWKAIPSGSPRTVAVEPKRSIVIRHRSPSHYDGCRMTPEELDPATDRRAQHRRSWPISP